MTEDFVLASAGTMRVRLLAAALDFWIKPAARSLLPRRKRAGLQRAVVELLLSLAPTRSGLRGGICDKAANFGQARTPLQALHGPTHELVTGACPGASRFSANEGHDFVVNREECVRLRSTFTVGHCR
jgi:predicted house-cleaning NTP pyrophosphatase (Maf/HAM1 superfamily)